MITRTRRARPTTPSPADYLGDTPQQAILPRPWGVCFVRCRKAHLHRVKQLDSLELLIGLIGEPLNL
jgi:hypothetical protein